jgi:hypothetical protein
MTNLEAIKAELGYPLSENAFILALTKRGLTSTDTFVSSQAYELAYADVIKTVITSPDIKEGGFSVTLKDTKSLISIASAIYKKYGEANPLSSLKPKATFKSAW